MKKAWMILAIVCSVFGVFSFVLGSVGIGVFLLLLAALSLVASRKKPKPAADELIPIRDTPTREQIVAFTVSGHQYYQDVLSSFLGEENPDWHASKSEIVELGNDGDLVYEHVTYITTPDLVPEPDNQYDANAIAVYVHGVKIGYVPRSHQKDVTPYMDDDSIIKEVEIYGGNYKQISISDEYDGFEDLKASDYEISRDSSPYKASVRLYKRL